MTNIKVFVNGNEVGYTTKEFNDGDLSVKFDPTDLNPDPRVQPEIDVKFYGSSKDLLELDMVLDAIKGSLVTPNVTLDIPYLPFNRQDKVFNDGEARSLDIVVQFLRKISVDGKVSKILLHDLHNEKVFQKMFIDKSSLENILRKYVKLGNEPCKNSCGDSIKYAYDQILKHKINLVEQHQLLPLDTWKSIQDKEKIVVFPDKGACEKIGQYGGDLEYITCEKKRDPKTGHLSNFSISGTYFDETKENPHFIIVDDICEGGGTFLGLYDVIKEKYPNCKIDLHTTFRVHENGIERYKELDEKFENVTYWYNIKEKTYYDK